MHTLEQLAAAGRRMRDLQREYFKTRDRGVLIASKEAEKAFDTMLAQILGKQPPAHDTSAHDDGADNPNFLRLRQQGLETGR